MQLNHCILQQRFLPSGTASCCLCKCFWHNGHHQGPLTPATDKSMFVSLGRYSSQHASICCQQQGKQQKRNCFCQALLLSLFSEVFPCKLIENAISDRQFAGGGGRRLSVYREDTRWQTTGLLLLSARHGLRTTRSTCKQPRAGLRCEAAACTNTR